MVSHMPLLRSDYDRAIHHLQGAHKMMEAGGESTLGARYILAQITRRLTPGDRLGAQLAGDLSMMRQAWQNGTIESFNGKFRDECLSMEWFRNRVDAKIVIEQFRRQYNEE